jgi:hypothetical protein
VTEAKSLANIDLVAVQKLSEEALEALKPFNEFINKFKPDRYRSLALTRLEEAFMYVEKMLVLECTKSSVNVNPVEGCQL